MSSTMANLTEQLIDWLRAEVKKAGALGTVVGISGGIDSAVVSVLCKKAFPDHNLGLIMPVASNPVDLEHAKLVADTFGIPYKVVDLGPIYESLTATLGAALGEKPRDLALANLKPRLRMLTLYYFANHYNYLVVGTGNRSELTVGYFTKYGDGGVDLLPIGGLVKQQVRELARFLGVPQPIIDKPPSAGLWAGQTDEGEMGLTYEELDNFILTGSARPEVKDRIEKMMQRSAHKKQLPLIFEIQD